MNKTIQLLSAALAALWLCGCTVNTIEKTWKAPAYQGGAISKIAVLAVDERGDVRMALENRLVREMKARQQEAFGTAKLLALPEIKADKEVAAMRLRAEGADAVLIIRLVDQATLHRETKSMPAFYSAGVSGYEGYTWFDYFSYATGMGSIRSNTERELYLESTLFDLKTGQRLWSALSHVILTQDGDALEAADKMAAKVAKALHKDGFAR